MRKSSHSVNTGVALFIFRRDLRIVDNTALNAAIKAGYRIIPIFILTPEQIDPTKNKYFSKNAVQFMIESLNELGEAIGNSRLLIMQGENVEVIAGLHKQSQFSAIYTNADYTPYAHSRDDDIAKWCRANNILFNAIEGDYTLLDFARIGRDKPYVVFSPYFDKFVKVNAVEPVSTARVLSKHFVKVPARVVSKTGLQRLYAPENAMIDQRGGRIAGLKVLGAISGFRKYMVTRDQLDNTRGTTHMSAHLKFGTISIREAYWRIRTVFKSRDHGIIRELVFRDFYAKIYSANPSLLANHPRAYDEAVDKRVRWRTGKDAERDFESWATGRTGIPVVDAGMRQLLATGYMHNRARMIVASVLTKYLFIDWRRGAQFFAQHLVDYDPISNTAGWGFSSSTGVDAQPWFRAPFNPFTQSKKFDPDAKYIKRWVPELATVSASDIHKWYKAQSPGVRYPAPIVDYKEAAAKAIAIYAP